MNNPDFRALCAELRQEFASLYSEMSARVDFNDIYIERMDNLLDRARAALAQPKPERPSESDVAELFYRHLGAGSEVGFENAIKEALARWGRPAIQPVVKFTIDDLEMIQAMCRIVLGHKFGHKELEAIALHIGHHPDVLNPTQHTTENADVK